MFGVSHSSTSAMCFTNVVRGGVLFQILEENIRSLCVDAVFRLDLHSESPLSHNDRQEAADHCAIPTQHRNPALPLDDSFRNGDTHAHFLTTVRMSVRFPISFEFLSP